MRRWIVAILVLATTGSAFAAETYRVRQGEILILEASELFGDGAKPDGATVLAFGREIASVAFHDKQYFIIGVDFRTEPGKYELLVCDGGKQVAKAELEVEEQTFPLVKMGSGRQELSEKTKKRIELERVVVENAICPDFAAPRESVVGDPGKWSYPLPKVELPASGGGFGASRIWTDGVSRHTGVDLRARHEKTYVIADGTVVLAVKWPQKPFFLQGYAVVIRHAGGISSAYFHLSKVVVSAGQKVKAGDLVGVTGESGNARGPHLHLSLFVNCAAVDPLAAIKKFQEIFR